MDNNYLVQILTLPANPQNLTPSSCEIYLKG
jgi:hypothetical protein